MIKFIGLRKSRLSKDKTLDTLHYLKLEVECEETEYKQKLNMFKRLELPDYVEYIEKHHQQFLLKIDKQLDNIEELL